MDQRPSRRAPECILFNRTFGVASTGHKFLHHHTDILIHRSIKIKNPARLHKHGRNFPRHLFYVDFRRTYIFRESTPLSLLSDALPSDLVFDRPKSHFRIEPQTTTLRILGLALILIYNRFESWILIFRKNSDTSGVFIPKLFHPTKINSWVGSRLFLSNLSPEKDFWTPDAALAGTACGRFRPARLLPMCVISTKERCRWRDKTLEIFPTARLGFVRFMTSASKMNSTSLSASGFSTT